MKAEELKEEVVRLLQARLEPLLPKMDGLTYDFRMNLEVIGHQQFQKGDGILYVVGITMKQGERCLLWSVGIQNGQFRLNNKFYDTVEELATNLPKVVKAKLKKVDNPLDLKKIERERDVLLKELLDKQQAKEEIIESYKNSPEVKSVVRVVGTNVFVIFYTVHHKGACPNYEAKCVELRVREVADHGPHKGEPLLFEVGNKFRPNAWTNSFKKALIKLTEENRLKESEE